MPSSSKEALPISAGSNRGRRLSTSEFNAQTIDLVMRTRPAQFTDDEIATLAALELEEPDEDALERFLLEEAQPPPLYAHGREEASAEHLQTAGSSGVSSAAVEDTADAEAEGDEEGVPPVRPLTATQRWQTSAAERRSSGLHNSLALLWQQQQHEGTSSAFAAEAETAAAATAGMVEPYMRKTKGGTERDRYDSDSGSNHYAALNNSFSVLEKADFVGGTEAIAEAILRTRHVDLSGRCLKSTAAVECFLNVTHLYLQHNALSALEGLELLVGLQVCDVSHNRIQSLQPLALLDQLMYLDCSHNLVRMRDPAWELPCGSLQYLNLTGNPCCPDVAHVEEVTAYRERICCACEKLEVLDNVRCAGSSTSSSAGDDIDDGEEDGDEESFTKRRRRSSASRQNSSLAQSREEELQPHSRKSRISAHLVVSDNDGDDDDQNAGLCNSASVREMSVGKEKKKMIKTADAAAPTASSRGQSRDDVNRIRQANCETRARTSTTRAQRDGCIKNLSEEGQEELGFKPRLAKRKNPANAVASTGPVPPTSRLRTKLIHARACEKNRASGQRNSNSGDSGDSGGGGGGGGGGVAQQTENNASAESVSSTNRMTTTTASPLACSMEPFSNLMVPPPSSSSSSFVSSQLYQQQHATSTSAVEERLLQQFLKRSAARRDLVHESNNSGDPNCGHKPATLSPGDEEGHAGGGGGVAMTQILEEDEPLEGDNGEHAAESDRLFTEARSMQVKLYGDINYAKSIAHERSRLAIEEQWKTVEQVVRTRHALVEERKRRIREMHTKRSKGYEEALELLGKESRRNDLDQYRKPLTAQTSKKEGDETLS